MKIIIAEIIKREFQNDVTADVLIHLQRSTIKIINTEHQKISYLRLDKEDLITNVYLAIKEVKQKYDINKNVPLVAYANFIIKRRILDYAKFLKRDKRKLTLKMINSYRSSLTEDGQTFLERDIDRYSYESERENNKRRVIKEMVIHFLENEATELEAKILKMLYKGFSQKEIIKILKIKRKDFLQCKEKLKKVFNYFNKDISNI